MSAAPSAGMLVHPDVRLLRPLCAGGMGTVWAAEHRKLRTEVAVKLISANLADDPVARARFDREATNASRVRSPHVVQILDYGVSPQGHPFIVMELLEGHDLRTRLQDVGALSPGEALSVAQQLCHALARAHARGIVHRDLKPSNVFLCDSPRGTLVKLLDFGVAKETGADGALTTTGAVGTPLYMSPEQLTGEGSIDHRSDIWALGVLTFEMLTGRRPFEATTTGALALAVHTLPLPSACALSPSLPAAVDAWGSRACARDRDERFDSAADAARGLELALDLPPPAIALATRPPRAGAITQTDPRPSIATSRRPSRALAGGALGLVVLASGLVAMKASSLGPAAGSTATPASPPALAAVASVVAASAAPATVPLLQPASRTPSVVGPPESEAASAKSLPPAPRSLLPAPRHHELVATAAPAPSASAAPPPAPPATVSPAPSLAIPVDRK